MPPKRKNGDSDQQIATSEHKSPGDQLGPSTKRQRVSQACDQCRTAREKCDGIQPHCYPCVSQNRQCTYQAKTKKRGVQTGYIRTLELALAWVFENVPRSEDALVALLTHEGGQGQRLLAGKESDATNRLHRKWRKSKAHRGIEHILSGVESPLPEVESPALEAASDHEDGVGQVPQSFRGTRDADEGSFVVSQGPPPIHQPNDSGNDHAAQVLSRSNPQLLPPTCRGLRLPSNHWRLLDIYFSYTHCWLPVLNKQELFQASYQYPADRDLDISSSDRSSGVHAELWSALALASVQEAAATPSSRLDDTATADQAHMSPDQICDTARSMIPQVDDGLFQLHHVRALLLLSLVHLGRERSGAASLSIGRAVRILLSLAGPAQSGEQHGYQQSQGYNVALIACFVLETMISIRYGIPSHLTANDMVDVRHISENDLDEWQPWTACDGFSKESSDSRALRNPAYCLSTFNQLFDILRIVSASTASKRGRVACAYSASQGSHQLQQSIKLNGPFGPYIISDDLTATMVPPPYILKMVYLWAEIAMGSSLIEGRVRLLINVIKEYQRKFGMCAVAPLTGICLAFVESHLAFHHLPGDIKQEMTALLASYRSIWNARGSTSPTPSLPNDLATVRDSKEDDIVQSLHGVSNTFSVINAQEKRGLTPRLPSANSATVGVTPPVVPSDQLNPYTMPLQQQRHQAPRLYSSSIAMQPIADTTRSVQESSAAEVPHLVVQNPQYLSSYPNWSTASSGPLDYDALLDDLASIDCADGVGTDPQFMTNLGFAPGCDPAEIYSQNFSQYQ